MKILVKVKAIDFDIDTAEGQKALEQAIAAAVKQVTAPIEKRVTALVGRVEGFKLAAKHAEDEITKLLDEKIDLAVHVEKREPFVVAADRPASPRREPAAPRERARAVPAGEATEDPALSTPKGELKKHVVGILTVLAQHPAGRTRTQTLILAGYQPSGDISTAFGAMLDRGWIQQAGQTMALTAAGSAALGPVDALPTGERLRELTVAKGTSAERKMLQAIFDHYPSPATRAQLHERAGLKPSGDTSTAIGKFIKLGWVEDRDGGLVAAATFFEE